MSIPGGRYYQVPEAETPRRRALAAFVERRIDEIINRIQDNTFSESSVGEDIERIVRDILNNPPIPEAQTVPLDEGPTSYRPVTDRGFYRVYDAAFSQVDADIETIPLDTGDTDVRQIAWELARECPVTGSVVFRMTERGIVAHLTQYVAFA